MSCVFKNGIDIIFGRFCACVKKGKQEEIARRLRKEKSGTRTMKVCWC